MTTRQDLFSLARHTRDSASLFVKDIGNGLLVVSHNTLALVGLAVVSVLLVFTSQAGLREKVEFATLGWLNARHEARAEADGNTLLATAEPDAIARATATDPRELSRQQAAVAHWLARRYSVAPEPISRLVQEAWAVGNRAKVEPTLILAIMALSGVGASGYQVTATVKSGGSQVNDTECWTLAVKLEGANLLYLASDKSASKDQSAICWTS